LFVVFAGVVFVHAVCPSPTRRQNRKRLAV
jgi:hypothetical protein